jgi:hypothetical protein
MAALPMDSPIGRLLAGPMQPGRLEWIGLRPARRAAILMPGAATLTAGHGVEGDHYDTQRNGPRQVTLVAAEDLAAIASFLGMREISSGLLRRNLVIRGINLLALKDRRFRVGTALLEGSGECAPCSRMEGHWAPAAIMRCAAMAASPRASSRAATSPSATWSSGLRWRWRSAFAAAMPDPVLRCGKAERCKGGDIMRQNYR